MAEITTGLAHADTGYRPQNQYSVTDMLSNSWESVKGGFTGAVDSVGSGISGGYSWIKGEVKGAADYTTDKASSLLFTVILAGAVVLTLYILFRKEVFK